jgi:glucose-1-phosphate thymidylyltransferase
MIKGVILAGGLGTRLRPITQTINKNLIPVGPKPMLLYPLEKLVQAGITKICITTGSEHMGDIVDLLGSGEEFGADITYRVQSRPGGISQAVALAEDFAGSDPFVVILGDNLFDASLEPILKHFNSRPDSAMVYTYAVADPSRFGVVRYDDKGQPIEIIEKPQDPPSADAVIGVYAYPGLCNGLTPFDHIRSLKPSERGELEITDLNNIYLRLGKLRTHRISGSWIDAGTLPSLRRANEWAWKNWKD